MPSGYFGSSYFGSSYFGSSYFGPSGGASVTIGATGMARRSLANIRRKLLRKLNSLTIVPTTAQAADATALIALELAGGLDGNAYRQAWVMPTATGAGAPGTSANVIRRVGEQALNVSTGQLNLTVPLPSTLPTGVDVEISKLLPFVSRDGMTGVRECINDALAECWFMQRLALTGVNGAPSYSLSAWAEWLDPAAIVELYGPVIDPTLNPMPWPGFAAVQDADGESLQVAPTFGTGEALKLEVTTPGDVWIKVGGVWGASSSGLVNDSDECIFQPDFVVQVALCHVYEALSAAGDRAEYWAQKAGQQRLAVNYDKLFNQPHPARRATHPLGAYTQGDPKVFGEW
jgi:hypothetical protein